MVYLFARGVIYPQRYIDEFLYWNLAGNLSHGRGLSWNGEAIQLRSWLYPLVIAPVFRVAGSVDSQYQAIQFLNSGLISLVVFPAWWMARRFVGPGLAFFAAVFAVSVPAMNYAGIIGTESLAYPTCTAAFAAMLLALARPGWRTAVTALLAIALAAFTRMQMVLLIPILATSLLLVAAMHGRDGWRGYLASQRTVLVSLGVGAILGAVFLMIAGQSSVGIYLKIFHSAPITIDNALYWLRGFVSDLYLVTGILPTVATFALLGARQNRRHRWVGPLLALALVASLFFTLQMTLFSAINTEHWRERNIFYERYMFYLGPIFFAGFVASFGRVSSRAAIGSTLVAVALVAGTPPDIIGLPFSIDAFGQAYIAFILSDHDSLLPVIGPLLAGLTVMLGALLVLSTLGGRYQRLAAWGRGLALGLTLFLLLITQFKAWSFSQIYSQGMRERQPRPLNFVERATKQRVAFLPTAESETSTLYATTFWNPNVERIFVSEKAPISSPPVFAPHCELRWRSDGTIVPPRDARPACQLTPAAWLTQSNLFSMHLRDETLRKRAHGGIVSTVTASDRPVRIFSLLGGRNTRHGGVSDRLELRSFLDRPGELELVVEAGAPDVSLRLPGGRSLELDHGRQETVRLPVAARDHLTRVEVVSTGAARGRPVDLKRVRLREGAGPWRDVS